PALPKCACVFRIAHFRTPAHGLRQHGCGNPVWCALQKTPYERAANAEAHHHKLINTEMIDQTKLIVGIGLPRPVDLDGTNRLATGGIAQIRRDTTVFSLELLNRVERRVTGEEADR